MLSRPLTAALLLALAAAPAAVAQTPPAPTPPPAPAPATPPAAQGQPPQAPASEPTRHTSTIKLGKSTLTIEHGQPAWSDGRLGEMAQQVPTGARWRMGSENMTTLVVKDEPVYFGGEILEPGRWGMNLQRLGENEWAFLAFLPTHTDLSPYVALGDEVSHVVPAKFSTDAKESVANLVIDLAATGDDGSIALAWGPMRATAAFTAIAVTHAEFQVNGHDATGDWFGSNLPAGADLSKPMLAGTIDLEIDDNDCSMNVYLMQEGANLVAVVRNRERDQAEQENARCKAALAQFEAMIQQFGPQAEAQIGPMRDTAKKRVTRNEVTLEDTTGLPDNLKFSEPASDATGNRLSCNLIKTRSGLHFEVRVGAKKAIIRIDENLFAVKSSS